MKDDLYATGRGPVPFTFDDTVASVFPDMIRRSVPGYDLILQQTAVLAREHLHAGVDGVDLGCSLGACSQQMARYAAGPGQIWAMDSSEAMIRRARELASTYRESCVRETQFVVDTLPEFAIPAAGLISLNFVLQFIPIASRDHTIRQIAKALVSGGVLLLSEKIAVEDDQGWLKRNHEGFKKLQGYSEMEIAGKRDALEAVLVPESLQTHLQRLRSAGLHPVVWLQTYNFVSILGYK